MKFSGERFSKRSGTCIWFVYQTLIQWGFNPPRLDPHPSSIFNKKEFTNKDFAIMHKCISSYLNKLELVEHSPYKKGDIIAFRYKETGEYYHVGILTGNTRLHFIHLSGERGIRYNRPISHRGQRDYTIHRIK